MEKLKCRRDEQNISGKYLTEKSQRGPITTEDECEFGSSEAIEEIVVTEPTLEEVKVAGLKNVLQD